MTAIPTGTKFVGIGASVPTPENKSSQNNAFQEVYTIDDIVAEAQDGMQVAPTTTVVSITSAQILDMHNTAVELLPAAGINMYYDIEKVILEYTHVTTAYTSAETLLAISSSSLPSISTSILISAYNNVIVINGGSDGIDLIHEVVVKNSIDFNTAITLSGFNGEEFTLGDGTLRAIITYTVRTFGA
jgi:hypothetical protein